MIRSMTRLLLPGRSKPRASGDDPGAKAADRWALSVNPARAGMIPTSSAKPGSPRSKPRASGDDPHHPSNLRDDVS